METAHSTQMKLPAYPKYKPTGVEWLGDVPEHWEVKRLGYLVSKIGSGKTPRGGADVYQSEGVMLIRSQNVYDTGLRLDDVVFVDESVDEDMAGSRVLPHDVLLNITGASLGRCAIAPDSLPQANVNQHVCIVRPTPSRCGANFIHRSMTSLVVQSQILGYENGSSREGLNFQQVRKLVLTLPPPTEQQAIAAFLDRETGRLDQLVAKKQILIERLKEKRTALISRTVTHGLPPAAARAAGLPANPKLKPSGIEWIDDIPEHWQAKRLKFELWKIEQGWSPQCDNVPAGAGEWGVLRAGAVNGVEFDSTENKRLPDEEIPLHEFEIKTGDFLISRANTRELLGSAALVRTVQPQLLLCDKLYRLTIQKHKLNSEFLLRFMRSAPGHYEFERDASGSSASMQNIGQQCVRNLWICVPPLPEQTAIAAYLDAETANLDALVGKVEEAVERLQEYRTALITAAVTGKIDVRQFEKTGTKGASDDN